MDAEGGARMTIGIVAATSYLGSVWEWLTDGVNWSGAEGVPNRFVEHVQISFVSLLAAVIVAVPIGLLLGHARRGGFAALNLANVGRAVPALAILILFVLIWGTKDPPALLQSIGIVSIPGFVALVLLAIPPVLTNTYVGVTGVDPDVRDAARGMGMSGPQVLRSVEFPLATPFIMAGIRTSAVAVIATATILAYTGSGGLGRFIIDGSAISVEDPRIFAGAMFVAVMALLVEGALALVQKFVLKKYPTKGSIG
jgi:osmoprotectant transport system permease protein